MEQKARTVPRAILATSFLFAIAALSSQLVPEAIPMGLPQDALTAIFLFAPVCAILVIVMTSVGLTRKSRMPWAMAATGATAISLAVAPWGLRQLGSYDLSPMVDLAWRYEQGQVPNMDFPATLPAAFMAGVRLTTIFSGSSWSALLIVGLIFAMIAAIAAAYFLARSGVESPDLLAFGTIAVVIPWVATTHLWHSSVTAQLGAVSVVAAVALVKRPSSAVAVALGVLLGLTAGSKQNVGWIVVVGVILLLAFARVNRARFLLVMVSAIVTLGLVAWIAGVGLGYPFASAFNFIGERERQLMVVPPGSSDLNGFLLLFFPWVAAPLALGLVVAFLAWSRERKHLASLPEVWGAFIAGLGWFAGILTNWDSHWNEFPLAGVALVFLLSRFINHGRINRARLMTNALIAITCFAFLAVAMGEGASRVRMRYVGPLFEDSALSTVSTGFLSGMKLGPLGLGAVSAQEAASGKWCGDGTQVVIGPRLEFLYAQWDVPSPAGLPLWWHPGSSYSVGRDLPGILSAFDAMRPVQFVSLGDDFTRMPDTLIAELTEAPVVAEIGPLRVRCLL